ncbi:type I toxin-antitoxin system Fst family toxin [Enterococcus sp. 669A]|uniref:Type I toxin-antitoxin system Fst family toxin n=1 Tax=Candidatus Enterococcus moelleringii TaxID=2815325 RepID=A0ABS3LDV7_9ENTE|nr:type I toxin-antitoxin system Fst family toxin [Enterococcus sp. 669A]MBO1307823.1 type I toxin-antitoxin system Fst family toxin [Enterococcus sp. 669A]
MILLKGGDDVHPIVQYIFAPIIVGLVLSLFKHWLDDHDP